MQNKRIKKKEEEEKDEKERTTSYGAIDRARR